MKATYLDLMEKIAGSYSTEDIKNYLEDVRTRGLTEHGFPRLTANLGILMAHGRLLQLQDLFVQMMDLCCMQLPIARDASTGSGSDPASPASFSKVGNDFSVREIITCLLALEDSGVFPTEKTQYWRTLLNKIEPYTCYSVIAKNENDRVHNWAAFGAASEQARSFAGIGHEQQFIDTQIASQLLSFDENGMYRDPNEPLVYDVTTRLQLTAALHYGYDGPYREQLDKLLEIGALNTLLMQSVTGEIPFGGRSNQFLHNEAVLAAVCEYEAVRHQKRGDLQLAGQFKSAARLAVHSIRTYLNSEQLYHVKNRFPKTSFYGCEPYAYFKKYMVTTASFLYLAYLFADDKIEPCSCPAEAGSHVFQTTPYFHKTMCRCGDYFIEYETNADAHYDVNGLGRIHRKGAPSAICLSTPFTPTPNYGLDIQNTMAASICCGIYDGKNIVSAAEIGTGYQLQQNTVRNGKVLLQWLITLNSGVRIRELCTISEDGIHLCYQSDENLAVGRRICCVLPAFLTDGSKETALTTEHQELHISYEGYQCTYSTSGHILDFKTVLGNRNGHYGIFLALGNHQLEVEIRIAENTHRSS